MLWREAGTRGKECLVTYRPLTGRRVTGWFTLKGVGPQKHPPTGALLDVWSAHPEHRGPFVVRGPGDQWWTGSGPDPVPSIPG